MVDPIKGSGGKRIIITKPKAKEGANKTDKSQFDKTLKGKAAGKGEAAVAPPRTASGKEVQLLQQQQMARMQRIEDIAQQMKDGTYKMPDPAALADKLFQIVKDKKTRDKFLKKFLAEEQAGAKKKGKALSELELKKIIYLVKNAPEGTFDDPELDQILQEFL